VLAESRALPPDGREAVRKVHDEVVGYFEDRAHRAGYPGYRAKGWVIGSGPVESACKTVVGKRVKGDGTGWGSDGADEMSHLRARFCSGERQWDAYWHPNGN
jgi:hypothetical protein